MEGWAISPPEMGARYLLDPANDINLQRSGVLVPGRRAGRLLRGALLRQSDGCLEPPRILTPSTLVDAFFAGDDHLLPVPDPVGLLAWSRTLASCNEACEVLYPARPMVDDVLEHHARARRLRSVCDELDSIGLTPSEVAHAHASPDLDQRWEALQLIRADAHRRLAELGYAESSHMRRALIDRGALRSDAPERLLVLAVTDPGPLSCRLYETLGDRCTILVDAPDSEADTFDQWGRPLPEAWSERPSVLELDDLELVDRPIEAAEQVLSELGRLQLEHGAIVPGRTVIGLCDEGFTGDLERAGRRTGVPLRSAVGRPLDRSRTGILLRALFEHLREPTLDSVVGLLRVPEFEAALLERLETDVPADPADPADPAESPDLLGLLDAWRADRVGATLADLRSCLRGPDKRIDITTLGGAYALVEQRIEPFARAVSVQQSVDALLGFLRVFSEPRTDDALRDELLAVVAVIEAIDSMPADQPLPGGCVSLLEIVLSELSVRHEVPEADPDALELLGWLELRHEPARDLVLVGLNEGGELTSSLADAWLPDSLRARLGLSHEARRFARDVHALHALSARTRSLRAIVSRHDATGNPVPPSRLVLAATGRSLAERVLELFEGQPRIAPAGSLAGTPEPASAPGFSAPRPEGPRVIETLSVTDFASWLRSPIDHWLERMERLDEVDPDALELDARQFGTFAHLVVESLGESSARDLEDPKRINRVLQDRLDQLIHACFGRAPAPAILFQRRTLSDRLRAFAEWQAEMVRGGWRIETIECDLDEQLEIPGADPVRIRGRIDRIDRHESGRLRLIDYKTSDKPVDPAGKRTRDGVWKDLQLPLYDHLLRRQRDLPAEETIELGYISLCADPSKVGLSIARDWNPGILEEAIDQARSIVGAMRSGDFEGGARGSRPSKKLRPIDRILRTGALDVAVTEPHDPDLKEAGAS